jgi:GH35 family endo-1,4-beta-xylanase
MHRSNAAMRHRCLLGALAVAAAGVAVGVTPAKPAAASSAWTNSATSGPPAESGAAMAWDAASGTDVLFTTGGQTLTWNGSAWVQLAPVHSPGARRGAAMAYDAVHSQVVLFGGVSGTTTLQDTWTWNGTDWAQRTPSNSPPWRGGASMAWDGKGGYVLMFGGFETPGVFYGDTWQWDGSNWNEQVANFNGAAAVAPSPRTLAQMSDNGANGSVVLFGGTSPQGTLNDTWVWYDTDVDFGKTHVTREGQWIPVTPTLTPPARSGGVLAYAALDGKFGGPVLFGGSGTSGLLQDTWTFDGSGWSQSAPSSSPPARRAAAAAAAPNGNMMLFGGTGGSGDLADTWSWSGTIDAAPLPAPTIASCPGVITPLPTTSGTGTLRGAAAQSHPGLYIGASEPSDGNYSTNPEEQITSGSQFNMIASSNQMWWSAVENEPFVFDFCDGDQFVAYAQAYHQSLRYHNLINGNGLNTGQTPNWVLSPVLPWTATSLSAVMKQWITTVIDHYRGKVSVFDVVNESIDPGGNPDTSVFEKVIGYPKFVEQAFGYARAANPQATLLYDDYGNWFGNKLTSEQTLINDLKSAGDAPDAVGLEMFGTGGWILPGAPPPQSADLATAMSSFAALGVKTAITQMTVPWFGTTPDSGFLNTVQPNVYSYVLKACLATASNCFMFMTWGVSDTYSAPTAAFAGTKGTGGALFDEKYQPRPAFGTVLALLQ